jgi:SAM-dependent methyltransferase
VSTAAASAKGLRLFRRWHYSAREKYRGEYLVLAQALVDTIDFQTHLEVGCGQGLLMQPLQEQHGKTVRGIEYSRSAEKFVAPVIADRITYGSFVDLPAPGTFDLVSCVEVLEHLPADRADDAVAILARAATKWLYVAAAIPKQPGVGHVNCQPTSYWLRKLDKAGWALDLERTGAFIDRLGAISHCYWLPQNALIFRPKAA